jgi:hypothetical protein
MKLSSRIGMTSKFIIDHMEGMTPARAEMAAGGE